MSTPGHSVVWVAAIAATTLMSAFAVSPSMAETIRVGGTGAALGTMRLLGDAFAKERPEHVVVVLPSLGSSGGIKALLGGAVEIAVSGRDVKPEEREGRVNAIKYGTTPFVFSAHREAPDLQLTKQSIADIYSGKTQNWSNGNPIRLVMRPKTESDTALLRKMSPAIDSAVAQALEKPGMVTAITDTDTADQIEKFPNSFGTATLALILSESRALKVFPVEGVMPAARTLSDGTYPYYKDCFIVMSAKPSSGTQQFVEFMSTPKGRDILQKTGHQVMDKKRVGD